MNNFLDFIEKDISLKKTQIQTLPIKIFSMTKRRVTPDIYALSTLIFLSVLVLLILINVAQARSEKKKEAAKR